MLPGAGVERRPALKIVAVKSPLAPPAMAASNRAGFMRTWGKAARARGREGASVKDRGGEEPAGPAGDGRQQQGRLHEDVGEVDLVDAAEEMDDRGAWGGGPGDAAAEDGVREQDTEPRPWVGLDHKEYGLAGFSCLLDGERGEDAVIYGVVQEEHLRRLDDDAYERQEAGGHHRVDASTEDVADGGDNGAGAENADDGEGAADDAGGEGVHQHLEALANPTLHEAVELHDDVTAQRSHDERAEEHRDVGTDDNADGGDRADHAAPHVVDHPPAGVGDQERQQVEDHGIDEFCRRLVRDPPVRDEERRDQTPRDERPEVGHHAR